MLRYIGNGDYETHINGVSMVISEDAVKQMVIDAHESSIEVARSPEDEFRIQMLTSNLKTLETQLIGLKESVDEFFETIDGIVEDDGR